MLIRRPHSWELPESAVTPDGVAPSRRQMLGGGLALLASASAAGAQRVDDDPSMVLYPFARNDAYPPRGKVTDETLVANYNNFIEFGSGKRIQRAAQALVVRPWTIRIDGQVEKPIEMGIDDLLRLLPREERIYRHRCVETWAKVVPWSGVPLKALLDHVRPLASAKYVRFETFHDPKMAPGQRSPVYGFPYSEAITIAEAANELAFLATGAYGKPLKKQFGAPVRLVLPWKYGFKSAKSVVRISFVEKRPVSLWEKLQPDEYGFWANVNPDVPHVRWSQEEEEVLGSYSRTKTLIFNGYAEQVAALYRGLENEKLFT
ncbi:MAG TPA: protein-methionine-sulfoxide reductase catalytic subunit MsrP [Beijerinckiaceae bacterium]|nr:protein-methionine-sulfoxide reductase catalytic subunit MsrP [Beijerinckiaceae bacterium]